MWNNNINIWIWKMDFNKSKSFWTFRLGIQQERVKLLENVRKKSKNDNTFHINLKIRKRRIY